MKTMCYFEFLLVYKAKYQVYERLGQAFVNRFIKEPWPELFSCSDRQKAHTMITEWLEKHQYTDLDPIPVTNISII